MHQGIVVAPAVPVLVEGRGVGLSLDQIATLVAYVAFMFGVCMLACIVPTRRALGVEPTEALRVE